MSDAVACFVPDRHKTFDFREMVGRIRGKARRPAVCPDDEVHQVDEDGDDVPSLDL